MSDAAMVTNGVVVTGFEHPEVISRGAVVWQRDRIVAVGPADALREKFPGAKRTYGIEGFMRPRSLRLDTVERDDRRLVAARFSCEVMRFPPGAELGAGGGQSS